MHCKPQPWAIAVILVGLEVVRAQTCYGPGDLDQDAVVGQPDLTIFARCLAGPRANAPPSGCRAEDFTAADLNEDGDVDLQDFSRFAYLFGGKYFDYRPFREDKEAEWLAIELSGQLRATDEEYDRIHHDLLLIRAEYPWLPYVLRHPYHSQRLLIVKLIDGADKECYAALNRYYVAVRESPIIQGFWEIEFCDNLNLFLLAQEYEALAEVEGAGPDGYMYIEEVCPGNIVVSRVGDAYIYQFIPGYKGRECTCLRTMIVGVDSEGAVVPIFCLDRCGVWCPF